LRAPGKAASFFTAAQGRDRAGLISLLVLSLASVTADAIAEDYELSLSEMDPLFRALGIAQPGPSMHVELQRRGITIRAAITDLLDGLDVAQLLRGAGVQEEDIAMLRRRLAG